ncbi:MAG: glycoside hydrolase family 99-like domain-containing protein [Hyphomicrobiales bacterium]|nr:glycoside hydrolase family 99-like domain-containing protein [Hyphomicrobiales bacterium]
MKILVGLIEHMGDVVACEPVARYLRLKHPNARITWVVGVKFRELIDANPNVDETIAVECLTDWIKLVQHQTAYDRVVDLHVNYRICSHCQIPLVKQHGHPFVSAYEWLDFGPLLTAFSIGAGLPPLAAQPRVYIEAKHAAAVDALKLPSNFCVVHRTSNSDVKDWQDDKWRALAAFIRKDLGLEIVDVGAGKGVLPLDGETISLVNKCSVLETAEVIRRARLFIGVDSGPAHLANALQKPGVVLLGRHVQFQKYNPFTGHFASDAPEVKLVRNLAGAVSAISVDDVRDAVRYVAEAAKQSPVPPRAKGAQRPQTDFAHARGVIEKSGVFDAAWYALHTPDLEGTDIDPLEHYLTTGGKESIAALPAFDGAWYLERYEDVRKAGIPPLVHYLTDGVAERREARSLQVSGEGAAWRVTAERTSAVAAPINPRRDPFLGDNVEPALSRLFETTPQSGAIDEIAVAYDEFPRTFAFYLPQFHPIPENNWAHGMGFTEWHNVVKGKPLFKGHYQPKMPGELGYYDLRSGDVLHEQIELARKHGIDGFCFYYYYFGGQKLLYKPIENYIKSDIDAPFLFIWANENWSRRWDGGDKEVIVEQHHSDFDDREFIRGLFETFADKRYVKVLGKPVLMVYKAHLFPDVLASTELWRAEAQAHGFPGLYLVMVDDWGPLESPRYFGFDASYEIPSNVTPHEVEIDPDQKPELPKDFTGRIIDYQRFAQFHAGRPFPSHKRFRTVMLPWDNAARYGSRAIVHVNVEGEGYRNWLSQALIDTYKRYPPEERFVFLHSWNEWCEGTYLEPDGKYGRRYLDQTRSAIEEARAAIKMHLAGEADIDVWALLNRVQGQKDVGAFRALSAARVETRYVNAELQRMRGEKHKVDVELDRLRGTLLAERLRFSQRTSRLTIKAIKLQIALAKFRRKFILSKSKRQRQDAMIQDLRSIVSAIRHVGGAAS